MARRKKGEAISGWVVVDKPVGPTSTQVVAMVRRLYNAQKAGHAGTLDPLASGILPVALGEATKTVPFILDATKGYRFTIRFGVATTTDDAEGTATSTSPVRPSAADIEAMLPRFTGPIEQVPPAFSAIKVDGERAYDLARAGEAVELKPRPVTIHWARLTGCPDGDHAELEISCSKGTYVRSLARDLALALGTVVTSTVIVEGIFGLPGIGSLLTSAIQSNDFPVIYGIVIFITIAVATLMVGMEFVYPLLDPRIKNQ